MIRRRRLHPSPPNRPIPRTRAPRPQTPPASRRFAALGLLVVAALLVGACSSNSSSATPSSASAAPTTGSTRLPPTLTTLAPPRTGSGAGSTVARGGRQVLEGFEEVTVHVRRADGTVTDYCLLLAESEAQRERGLMEVTDPSLGGHPGMLFLFERDENGAFWMKDTVLPLSIAYVSAAGEIVSTTDMEPCAAGTTNCPTYAARAPYRYAVEVPKGELAKAGLESGARLTVGDKSCAAPPA